jgi:peptide/nickel transport system ATP-binding protein
MSESPILEVKNLKTEFLTERGTVKAVNNVNYSIEKGEMLGIVGESGAGKSVTGLSILDLIESPGQIVDGEVRYKGQDLLSLSDEEFRHIRGDDIAMIFQDPMTSLNPAYTIGTQIIDTICEHKDTTKQMARERAIELLGDVGIPDPSERVDSYPHEFSGGMRQRALIAMALSCDPDLLIADEPTTALDVTIQAQILELVKDLQDKYDLTIQLITHDMGVIVNYCDRVGVMYAGEIVEEGTVREIFETPRHPYTIGLMNAIPRIRDPRDTLDTIPGTMPDLIETPSGCSFRDRCPHATEDCASTDPPLEPVNDEDSHRSACIRIDTIDFGELFSISELSEGKDTKENTLDTTSELLMEAKNVKKYFDPESQGWFDRILGDKKQVHAVDEVSLTINRGETLGLVGESGCGKTTLGRALTQLYDVDDGSVVFAGSDLTTMSKREIREKRKDFQMIFQDPFSSLNPRKTVRDIIGRPLEIHNSFESSDEKEERIIELIEEVGLETGHLDRYPHEFSGGQKQRIGIARALAVEPDFIVADEPVSALDVSVQAKILNLLMDLQDEYGLTYLFIAHDLNVVQHIADRIGVMYLGELVELGDVDQIFTPPYHPYTEVLLTSIPRLRLDEKQSRVIPTDEPPSPIDPPSGCRFHTRCPHAFSECSSTKPRDIEVENGHNINCHLYDDSIENEEENVSAQGEVYQFR